LSTDEFREGDTYFIEEGLVEEGAHVRRVSIFEEIPSQIGLANSMRNPLETHLPNYLGVIAT
jgi:hypothetical protein